jgi:predicted RNase H-like HicB family nuclease
MAAGVPAIPGAMAYGSTQREAVERVAALTLRVLADRIEHGQEIPVPFSELLAVSA